MKNLIFAVVFLAVAFFVGTELHERAKDQDWLSSRKEQNSETHKPLPSKNRAPKSPSINDWEAPSYPARMELSNKEGQLLRVTLLGRDKTHIFFLRHGDNKEFRYAISHLDDASRKKVTYYPESPARTVKDENRKLHALHRQSLEEQVERISQRSLDIQKEYRSSHSKTERRTLMREYEALQRERLAFELEIDQYK